MDTTLIRELKLADSDRCFKTEPTFDHGGLNWPEMVLVLNHRDHQE